MKVNDFILTIFVLILAMGTSSAEIYKWVDDKGVIHFSDSGPQDDPDASNEEEVSSADPEPQENATSNEENPNGGLPPNFFDLLDESAEEGLISFNRSGRITTGPG